MIIIRILNRFRWSLFLVLVVVIATPSPSLLAIGLTVDGTSSSIRAGAGIIGGTGEFHEVFITSFPGSGSTSASSENTTGGYANAAVAYSFTDTPTEAVFSMSSAASILYSAGGSAGTNTDVFLFFTPTENLDYAILGSSTGFALLDSYAHRSTSLVDGGFLYDESDASRASAFSFQLNVANDGNYDAFGSSSGSLTGTLLAGQEYQLIIRENLSNVFLSTGGGEAIIASTLTLRLTSRNEPDPTDVPDSGRTFWLLALPALMLLARRRLAKRFE